MKKRRGQRKYYNKLRTENDFDKATWLNFSKPNIWFDNWHLHFDWKGLGNTSFKKRKPHLDKLFRHFDLLERETLKLQIDFQLYAVIFDCDSAHDSLYLNTPNPNTNIFPFSFDNIGEQSTLTNPNLSTYIDRLTEYEKYYGTADENICIVFKKNLGIKPIQTGYKTT